MILWVLILDDRLAAVIVLDRTQITDGSRLSSVAVQNRDPGLAPPTFTKRGKQDNGHDEDGETRSNSDKMFK